MTILDNKKRFMQEKPFDDLYTPRRAVELLMPYIDRSWKIWEPACGTGNIVSVLQENGYDVFGSDIKQGKDFLRGIVDTPSCDCIVTNPPYSRKDSFLAMCYLIGKPFALLLPLTALEGVARGKMFRKRGISVLVLDRRMDFTGKGANWYNTSWFCWNMLPQNNQLIFAEVVNHV